MIRATARVEEEPLSQRITVPSPQPFPRIDSARIRRASPGAYSIIAPSEGHDADVGLGARVAASRSRYSDA